MPLGPQPSVYARRLHIRRSDSKRNIPPQSRVYRRVHTDRSDPYSIYSISYQRHPEWGTPNSSDQFDTLFTLTWGKMFRSVWYSIYFNLGKMPHKKTRQSCEQVYSINTKMMKFICFISPPAKVHQGPENLDNIS